jgi:acylphosphatase
MVENIKTYRVILSGRVQGVGFRYFVESIAPEYNIKGYVRNTFNRKVEVVCQGEEGDLEKFINEIKKGPSFSFVTNAEIEEIKEGERFNSFEIRY